MYSYADRIRAVELFLELGKRIRATILKQGYPRTGRLESWPVQFAGAPFAASLPIRATASTIEPLLNCALNGVASLASSLRSRRTFAGWRTRMHFGRLRHRSDARALAIHTTSVAESACVRRSRGPASLRPLHMIHTTGASRCIANRSAPSIVIRIAGSDFGQRQYPTRQHQHRFESLCRC